MLFTSVGTAQSKSLSLEDLTWTEVRDAIAAGKTTAIYYAGSTEENGPAVALGKHNFIARYVAQHTAEELGNALVYPTMPFAPTGDPVEKTKLMGFTGTINVSDETFGLVAREVALSAISAGFKNVILMGEHGWGQDALKRVAEELNGQWAPKSIHVYYILNKGQEQIDEYLAKHKLTMRSGGPGSGVQMCNFIHPLTGKSW